MKERWSGGSGEVEPRRRASTPGLLEVGRVFPQREAQATSESVSETCRNTWKESRTKKHDEEQTFGELLSNRRRDIGIPERLLEPERAHRRDQTRRDESTPEHRSYQDQTGATGLSIKGPQEDEKNEQWRCSNSERAGHNLILAPKQLGSR